MPIPQDILDLLRAPSLCFVTTLMKDGSPQTTETWVDTDGEHVVINTVDGFQKVRNISRDPRVTVVVCDPKRPTRYAEIRGDVIRMTTEGAPSTSTSSPTSTPAGRTSRTETALRPG